ncbi:amidase signature domain-containing protein [Aspergillus lucknowensis]|uniref:amidase n=1 Tax=Aspergillus lucknowensis TaxID=176173 RepID=A0ABR4LHF0_9EURO
MKAAWEWKAEKCRQICKDSMNPEWLLPESELPGEGQLNVVTFPDTCGLLTSEQVKITKLTANELVEQMHTGKLSAVEVTTAFLKRAHVGNQLVNFVTEFMVEEALDRAAELDDYFKATGKLVGPLHGVPISVKEHVGLKNRICHASYVAWTDHIPKEDALLVRLLRNAGGVFIARTNQPQSIMHMECNNIIYGETVNPYNRNLTAGGSSGGEGASIGLHCAALGIGTDIGGSIRYPAAFCGSYGLRITALRNPYKGVFLAGGGNESIRCVIGPLANSIADLKLFQKAVIDQKPWEEETSLIPLPWKELPSFKPEQITVGIMWDDGIVRPFPPMTRALQNAKSKLESAGVKLVNWEPYEHRRGWDILRCLYFPDTANTQKAILEEGGEPVHPLTEWAFAYGKPRSLSLAENWELNVQREEYRADYHRTMNEHGVDFILCPPYTGAASEIGTGQYWHYTAIWNILDQPAVIFPTRLVTDPQVDKVDPSFRPRNPEEKREWKKYVPEKFANAPLALQVVGKHFQDEATLEAAELISKIVLAD